MYVIKVGGALDGDLVNVCHDIQILFERGQSVVVVHGGSAEANRLGEQLGCPPRYLEFPNGTRSRYTDAATLDVLTLAMAGRVNSRVVEHLSLLGVPAIGLSGIDGGLVAAEKTPPTRAMLDGRMCIIRDDRTGRVAEVNTDLLRLLLCAGYVPVVSPPVLDRQHGALNTDADRMAAAIAVALNARWLITLSNVPGLLRDPADPESLIRLVDPSDRELYLSLARGRMRVKLQAAFDAIAGGVAHVALADGRLESPIQAALAGGGTTIGYGILREEVAA